MTHKSAKMDRLLDFQSKGISWVAEKLGSAACMIRVATRDDGDCELVQPQPQ